MAAHAREAPEPILRRRPDVPRALASIVMRCLEKQPADRPQDGEAIVLALSGAATQAGTDRMRLPAVLRRAPAWLPWLLAGAATVVAITFFMLYKRII
jgi:hypothetical protein